MDFKEFYDLLIIMSLVSAIINVILYSVGYLKVRKSKVDGNLIKIKNIMLMDLLVVFVSAICFTIIFTIVIFAPVFTTPALYFLGFVLFGLNVAYNIKAITLATIVENYEKGI